MLFGWYAPQLQNVFTENTGFYYQTSISFVWKAEKNQMNTSYEWHCQSGAWDREGFRNHIVGKQEAPLIISCPSCDILERRVQYIVPCSTNEYLRDAGQNIDIVLERNQNKPCQIAWCCRFEFLIHACLILQVMFESKTLHVFSSSWLPVTWLKHIHIYWLLLEIHSKEYEVPERAVTIY